jgi:2-keto-4-pentenoate hydratase/2-oxohepta-3-ene-1,7-dioic acid hydratase in catechol pathway
MVQKSFGNVYCVGRNYVSFANEMGNLVTDRPIIFLKPTHSIEMMNGNDIPFNGDKGEFNCEAEIVLHIGRPYEKGIHVHELIDKITLGIDFTYREVLNEMKKEGKPWLPAKGLLGTTALGGFLLFSDKILEQDFKLVLNGETLQVGNVKNMIFPLQTLVNFIGENYGLGEGDLIFTGTPKGIGKINDNDSLLVQWGKQTVGACKMLKK